MFQNPPGFRSQIGRNLINPTNRTEIISDILRFLVMLLGVSYNAPQRFADLRWAGFSAQMFMRSTKLSATTKLSAEHETPPIANVLL